MPTAVEEALQSLDAEDALAFVTDASNNIILRRAAFEKLKPLFNDQAGSDPDTIKMVEDQLPKLLRSADALNMMDAIIYPVGRLMVYVNMNVNVMFECVELMRTRFLSNRVHTFGSYEDAAKWVSTVSAVIDRPSAMKYYEEHPGSFDKILADWVPYCARYKGIDRTLYLMMRDIKGRLVAEKNRPPEFSEEEQEQEIKMFAAPSSFAEAVNPNNSISYRRIVISWAIETIRDGGSPSKGKKAKEAAEAIANEVHEKVNVLASDPQARYFSELLEELVRTEIYRLEELKIKGDAKSMKWLVDFAILMARRVEHGDKNIFYLGTGLITTIIHELKRAGLTQDIETVTKTFLRTLRPDMPTKYIQACTQMINLTQIKVDAEIIPDLLSMVELGLDAATSGIMAAMSTDFSVFEHVLERILRSTSQHMQGIKSMIIAMGFQKHIQMFYPHIGLLLELVTSDDTVTAGSAVSLIYQLAQNKPELFATPEIFLKTFAALETESSLSATHPLGFYLFSICGSVLKTQDRALWEVVIREMMRQLEYLYEYKYSDPQFSNTLLASVTALKTVAMSDWKELLAPHKSFLEKIANDTVRIPADAREAYVHLLNELEGITIAALRKQLFSTMHAIGVDPEDPFFEAVKNAQENEKRDHYDVMLSYNWSHQKTVLRIRDSLRSRGLTVWMDLDQMGGNVYAKMAEAVLGSDVIIPCLTAAYEASGNCKRELGFAADQTRSGKKIVPVRLENRDFTWSALITAGLLYTYIGDGELNQDTKWNAAMDGLAKEIRAALPARTQTALTTETPPSSVAKNVESVKKENGVAADTISSQYDVMLSYNWGHQPLVLKVRDYLQKKGLKVWMDVDEMSGNVYGKMAEAVMGAKVIVTFLTAKYEQSGNCKREFEFASSQAKSGKKALVPLMVEPQQLTWTATAVQNLEPLQFDPDCAQEEHIWQAIMEHVTGRIQSAIESLAVQAKVVTNPKDDIHAASVVADAVDGSVAAAPAAESITKEALQQNSSSSPSASATLLELSQRVFSLESVFLDKYIRQEETISHLQQKVSSLESALEAHRVYIENLIGGGGGDGDTDQRFQQILWRSHQRQMRRHTDTK